MQLSALGGECASRTAAVSVICAGRVCCCVRAAAAYYGHTLRHLARSPARAWSVTYPKPRHRLLSRVSRMISMSSTVPNRWNRLPSSSSVTSGERPPTQSRVSVEAFTPFDFSDMKTGKKVSSCRSAGDQRVLRLRGVGLQL